MWPCTRRIVPAEEAIKATIVERRAVIFAPYLGHCYRGHGCGT